MRDFYKEIDKHVTALENGRYSDWTEYQIVTLVSDRITWAWKFRKITEKQKNELCDRMIAYFNGGEEA